MKKLYVLIVFAVAFSSGAFCQDSVSYSLFNPVPRANMRDEMETDRPNVTESPYTVDAGHLQYEADLVKFQRERTDAQLQRTWLINQTNIKVGILKNTSLHIIVQSYGREEQSNLNGLNTKANTGFGDITLRVKQSVYGNYKGNFSVAVMPYVKLPTNRYSENKLYETGLMVPIAVKLPGDWNLGFQLEGDYLKDDDQNARHAEFLQSLVISHVLFDKLEVFGETYYTYNFKEHNTVNYIDAALQYSISKDLKVDLGVNHGLQKKSSDDYFLGIAFRY